MAIQQVREYFRKWGRENDIMEFPVSSATVELAARALGVEPARIAKTLALRNNGEGALLIVTAGDVKIDAKKFKSEFGFKPRMLNEKETLFYTGHPVGGVCPFALAQEIPVYLDISLKRFATVFPACGSSNSAIELTPDELAEYARCQGWVDVAKAQI
ncbi:Cys-tRNA(Pro) deacylase, prolyl-tRNA editing enzyme YbaK/EbsC [Thermosyntropha lipolytica DSM 11003]|uniref:Cys-tRNA(Pro) deacylase, prolyl-tRNA editing enzyme YbaK/EbsC n=1 Tax=Thermosyntropha lipolytica DSM 11003 TaxID=1123382 RepID=A0A1M5LXB1_9FIRM|nr:YbaK/EbsC family protein [Thermosyntropha lipolytica]SHG69289.1 Cys-tRNA(Pro) deacylase, prolyl-tRNA editing enzyme YbaK/EbsC [Thermosyntropha lipolytica DSM 11003]